MATESVQESVDINAELGAVYDVIGDVESYPEWLDEFKDAEVLATREDGWAERARFTLASMGLSINMVLAYTYTDTRMSWELVEGDMVHRNDGAYDLVDNGDGTTTLTYELLVETNVPLPGMVRKRLARKTVLDSLKAIKQRAETR
ncbi:MAG TPA: SRPBCC family protein [Euzebya sp.]|nr:SRPBCC family protein [Euzebya sp.]